MNLGTPTISKLSTVLEKDFKKELRAQGHFLTGALEESTESIISGSADNLALEIDANDYINALNDGIPAENIPFGSGRVGSATSPYIEGLKRYAMLRFGVADEKRALQIAFAIAKKHSKEGMPTASSYQYASNGRRTHAIEDTYSDNEKEYDQLVENSMSDEIDDLIDKQFDKTIF